MPFSGIRSLNLRLPKHWKESHQNAFLHAISLAHAAITSAISHAWNSRNPRLRDQAKIQRLQRENYLLREQVSILLARFGRLPPMQRPRYRPTERLRILAFKAAQRLSLAKTAAAFLVETQTIYNWVKDARSGENRLLKMPIPVNRFPEFVRNMVRQLKAAHPNLGMRMVVDILSRTGIHLATTTGRRFCKEEKPTESPKTKNPEKAEHAAAASHAEPEATRIVTARYPDHVWHIDLTLLPTGKGFWVPWLPHAIMQCWPFCWWVFVVVDHYSRRIVKIGVWKKQPTSEQVCKVLAAAVKRSRRKPKYVISDKGTQFWQKTTETFYGRWCLRRNIKLRFGALKKHGSIAVVERCIRTIKEAMREVIVSYDRTEVVEELDVFAEWYNEHRPHQFLNGRTPHEAYYKRKPKNKRPRFEPRPLYPIKAPCASPQAPVRGSPGVRIEFGVSYFAGRRHLPIVKVKQAA